MIDKYNQFHGVPKFSNPNVLRFQSVPTWWLQQSSLSRASAQVAKKPWRLGSVGTWHGPLFYIGVPWSEI